MNKAVIAVIVVVVIVVLVLVLKGGKDTTPAPAPATGVEQTTGAPAAPAATGEGEQMPPLTDAALQELSENMKVAGPDARKDLPPAMLKQLEDWEKAHGM